MDIHVSDLLGCPRKAWFDKQIEYPALPSSRLIVTFGTLQHALLEEMEDENYLAETIVEASGVVGTVDAWYKDGRILDYKTKRNANPKYLPEKKHVMQVNIYAHMLREEGKEVNSAAIQYLDFMGPTKCPRCKAFAVPIQTRTGVCCPICSEEIYNGHFGALLFEVPLWEPEKAKALVEERQQYLLKHIEEDTMPENTEPDFFCTYCPFLNMCEEGQAEIIRRK